MDTTVAKAFSVLEVLARSDVPLGVTDLAQRLELGKSNVHRLLQTLLALGYAKKTDGTGYVATLRMWELGCNIVSNLALRDVARPYMRQLSNLTNEAVHLSELQGSDVIYIDKIESKEPVRAYTQLGGRAAANCAATGKIILAYLPADDVREIFRNVIQVTPNTIMDVVQFFDQSAISRKRRYALNGGEWRADVNGLASPIANQNGKVFAGIGISAPASRLDVAEIEKYAPHLIEAGRKISLELGCSKKNWDQLTELSTDLVGQV
ncbi:IclR family transcriptional regulator [Rhodobacteraceae bacterium KMM 6894]|nr:IclR family transcriptional regulator [Rhodobacteraceae bacterium KMM 6894]